MSTARYYLDYTWNGENWFQMSNWPAKNADPKTRMQFSSRDEALERAKPWCGYGPAQFRIERVEDGVSTFEIVGGWTRVEDGLPRGDWDVLISDGRNIWIAHYECKPGQWVGVHPVLNSVTHWQPLPEPPA